MKDSSLGRFLAVLLEPSATFRSIAERPTWILPLVILLLLAAASTVAVLGSIDAGAMRAEMEQQIEERGGQADEQALDMAARFGTGCFAGSAIGGSLVFYLLIPAIFMIFNLFEGKVTYPQSLSTTLYGMTPIALKSVLSIPVVLSRESLTLAELQSGGGLLPSNLAVFAPEGAAAWLVALLSSVDLFTLWSVVLFVVGYSIVARVSKGVAAGVVVGFWLLAVVGLAGLATLGGGPR
jgi:hypothetical protein